ncbi:putative bifunctional diguanylate cyclase/phosphodiesterase [Neopusillimonas aromaticivorans]|uniref:putative bifunctional diguanylate cyclase/phosphodiesterase n=1 Tax=Neopusillimonas aromaticivorans TaxID=2979868 RepID=UPI0033153FBE
MGHIYKVIAYFLIYRAFVVEAIERPYTELAVAEQSLRQDEERFRRALEAAPNAMLMVDDTQTIVLSNGRSDALFGYERGDLIGKPLDILVPDTLKNTHKGLVMHYMQAPSDRPMGADRFLHARRKNGDLFRVEIGLTPLAIKNRTFILASVVDITGRLEAEARIEKLIYYDSLTDLPNRQLLKDRVNQLIANSRQNNALFGLLYLDLDRFKNVNETLGHSVGDRLLAAVAKRLQAAAGSEATIARVVGDEFVVVITLKHEEDAARLARQLLAHISKPYSFDEHHLALTPSIGIALYPEDGEDFDTLMKSADMAMQLVKLEGRNDFHFFAKEMQQRTGRMLQLESALLSAIDENQLHLVYQPQVRIADGKVIGVEALLRWNHPELGAISPAEFMPIAENSGQIITIGALGPAYRGQPSQTHAQSGSSTHDHVGQPVGSAVSSPQPHRPGERHPDRNRTAPEYLELELTESAAMLNPDHAIHILQTLHKRGVRLSIDDFGTGYSSLSYLKKFNIYKLKIDQSFVRDIATDVDDRAIVSAIIQMADSLGFHTIAEGVETQAQLDFLRERGCTEIQGYLYSKPLPADALDLWLQKISPWMPDKVDMDCC